MSINMNGQFFDPKIHDEIRMKFYHLDDDPCHAGKRLFFDNAGGAFRLKSAIDAFAATDSYPDCPERVDKSGNRLAEIWKKGIYDTRIFFNAQSGEIATNTSASQCLLKIIDTILSCTAGDNVVVTGIDHPASFDASRLYCEKHHKELRVAKCNSVTGGCDTQSILDLVDENTCLLAFIHASNTSGAILDAENIVKNVRNINPDIYVVLDSVQYAPHGIIDVQSLDVDACCVAPYKFYANRGIGLAFLSQRLFNLPMVTYESTPSNYWTYGSPVPGLFAGVSAFVDYICWIGNQYLNIDDRRILFTEGMKRIVLHERALLNRIINGTGKIPGLRNIPGVTLYLDYHNLESRELLICMKFDHLTVKESGAVYEEYAVTTYPRTQDSRFSKRMLDALNVNELLRITPCHVHASNEIDDFLLITQEIAQKRVMPQSI